MTEDPTTSTFNSVQQTFPFSPDDDTPERDPYYASVPSPTQENHFPMVFRPIYHFDADKQSWIACTPVNSSENASILRDFNIITWNIDFMQPYGKERYLAAINFLESFLTTSRNGDGEVASEVSAMDNVNSRTTSTIILLQEIYQCLLEHITSHPFVREYFIMSDISGDTWLNDDNVYGVVTLIPKSLSGNVASVFRTNFPGSRMGREALYVDLFLPNTEDTVAASSGEAVAVNERESSYRYLRITNVHLESLRGRSDAERVEQLSSTVAFLAAPGVYAGIVAGDMNPIGPGDAALPTSLDFIDAWVVDTRRKKDSGGYTITDQEIDDDPVGHTWGYQPPTSFSPRRMDKVLMRGCVDVQGVEKIGENLEVEVDDDGEVEVVWVTDHCGLFARLRVQ